MQLDLAVFFVKEKSKFYWHAIAAWGMIMGYTMILMVLQLPGLRRWRS